jgi:NitT/TauT family transport system substrate-binding protein
VERKRSKWLQTLPIARGQLGRRQFLRSVAGVGLSAAGLALLDGCASRPSAPGVATETLETTTIKVPQFPSICVAAQYVAEELLQREGFADVQYVKEKGSNDAYIDLASGKADISLAFAGPLSIHIDAGAPIVMLAGAHVGCFELFGNEGIRSVSDLKGKNVAALQLGGSQHVFLSSMMAYVGLDPRKDVNWVTVPAPAAIQLFAEGKIDAYLGFPPEPQELRAKKIGHVVVNSMMDKPWSQYFCCMVAANQQFVQKNPVATKRALRAILKAADLCAREPERVAQFIVDKGYTKNYTYALEAIKHIPYNKWRDYDPADTLRFYALRLHDAGMVKGTPDQIIAKGADWRFLNELKQELPAPTASAQGGDLFCRLGQSG